MRPDYWPHIPVPPPRFAAPRPVIADALSPRFSGEFSSNQAKEGVRWSCGNAGNGLSRFFESLPLKSNNLRRKIGFWLTGGHQPKEVKAFHELIRNAKPGSRAFSEALVQLPSLFPGNFQVEINTESGLLASLGKSDEACIFMMNHDNQEQDPYLLGIFLSALYGEALGKDGDTPVPAPGIIVNKDILEAIPAGDLRRAIMEKIGCVGVDPALFGGKEKTVTNARKMKGLVEDFVDNRRHIFLFPEGLLGSTTLFTPEERFQTGICDLIRLASRHKKTVKIIPLGFSVNEGKSASGKKSKDVLASLHMGTPIVLKRTENNKIQEENSPTPESPAFDLKDPKPLARFLCKALGQARTEAQLKVPVESLKVDDANLKFLIHEKSPEINANPATASQPAPSASGTGSAPSSGGVPFR